MTTTIAPDELLHRIVDMLPHERQEEAVRLLWPLVGADDPVVRAFLLAPEDDEPLSDEEIAALEEAREEIRRGDVVPWEEAKRQLRNMA